MTNADDEMSASDRILMQALAQAIGGPRPPIDLAAALRRPARLDRRRFRTRHAPRPARRRGGRYPRHSNLADDTRVRRRRRQLRDRAEPLRRTFSAANFSAARRPASSSARPPATTYVVADRRLRRIRDRRPTTRNHSTGIRPDRRSRYPHRLVRHLGIHQSRGKHRHEPQHANQSATCAAKALALAAIVCGSIGVPGSVDAWMRPTPRST